MDKRFREALSEIYEILLYIDQKSFDEIPFEVVLKITENKSKEYVFKIDENERELGEIIENRIKEETKEILAYLYLKYWNKKESEELDKELNALEETMKLQGIYDIFTLDISKIRFDDEVSADNIKNKSNDKNNNEDMEESKDLVKHENIFIKIKNILIKFFQKFGKKKKSE